MQVPAATVQRSLDRLFARHPDNRFFSETKVLWREGKPISQMVQAMSLRPELLDGLAALGEAVYPGGTLERSLGERVLLEMSRLNECQFCTDAHVDYIEELGISGRDQALADQDAMKGFSERERAAVEYARAMKRDANRVPPELKMRLGRLFSPPEIVELTFTIGLFNTLNWFNNALENRYAGEYEGTISSKA
jgi:AhpD family alkylhydroperoxidase